MVKDKPWVPLAQFSITDWKIVDYTVLCFLGVDEVNNATLSLEEALKDDARIDYYREHLYHVQSAIRCVKHA